MATVEFDKSPRDVEFRAVLLRVLMEKEVHVAEGDCRHCLDLSKVFFHTGPIALQQKQHVQPIHFNNAIRFLRSACIAMINAPLGRVTGIRAALQEDIKQLYRQTGVIKPRQISYS